MIGVFEAIKIGTNFCDIQNDTPYFGRCVVIRDIIFLNDSKCFHLESCIALRQCWSLMNLWIMIELDMLYKSANETFSLFLKGDVKKMFFLSFVISSLFVTLIWLNVVIRKTTLITTDRVLYRRPLIFPLLYDGERPRSHHLKEQHPRIMHI